MARLRRGFEQFLGPLLFLALLLVGCESPSPHKAQATPTRSSAPQAGSSSGTPAWRIAYLGTDGRMHTVRPDGTDDHAGLLLPMPGALRLQNLAIPGGGRLSPDGRYLVYDGVIAQSTVPDGSGTMQFTFGAGGYEFAWRRTALTSLSTGTARDLSGS